VAGRNLNVEPARLESHVRFFQRRKYLFAYAKDITKTADRTVCFTFDDAYASTLTYGIEVLKRLKAPATFYAVPGHVGGVSAWDPGRERALADWALLKSASDSGFEVGNHTMTHARLPDLNQSAQAAEWTQAHATMVLEGLDPQSACYPYGLFTDESRSSLEAIGYRAAVSIDKWPGGDDPLRLARIVVAYGDALPMLVYKLWVRPMLP